MAKVLHGDAGNNQLNASENKTQVYGLKGNDTLISDNKSDVLLVGGSGDDSLIMLGGNGSLSGGEGSDVFELNYSADKKLSAVIEDLNPSEDKILVKFDGSTAPQLTSSVSGNDVVWKDGDGNFNLTLKSVRDNDYFDGNTSEEAWKVLEFTNARREAANESLEANESLSALTMSQGLTEGASIRAKEITSLGVLGLLTDHTRPDDKGNYKTVFKDIGRVYHNYAENLDGGAVSPEEVVRQWIDSEEHRKNILDEEDKNYSKIGIGYNYDDPDPTNHRYYWTQLFGDSLTSDSLGNPETVTSASLLTANIETDTVTKFIQLTEGDNTVENSDYGVTISGTAQADSINNAGLNVSISGGADKDTISSSGSFTTIFSGTGDDSISLSSDSKENLIQYELGDGNDTISGLSSTDTVSISGDEFTPAIVGDNIVVAVGTDSITLADAVMTGVNIHGTQSKLVLLTEDDDNHTNDAEDVTIKALGGDDTINNRAINASIEGDAGNDSISNTGWNVLINGDAGDDTVENFGNELTIDGGDGKDSIVNSHLVSVNEGESIIFRGTLVSIYGGNDDDTIENEGFYVQIDGDAGNDFINNEGPDVSISGGTGNDTILNSGSMMLSEGVLIYDGSGRNLIVNIGSGVAILGGYDSDTVYHHRGSNVMISVQDGNDEVGIFASNVSVSGGADNDKINMPSYVENILIIYNEGDGQDVVRGFNETDTLRIGDGTGTYSAWRNGDDIIVRVGGGSITLSDTAAILTTSNIEGTSINSNLDNDLIVLSEDDDIYRNEAEGKIIFALAGNDSIYNTGNNVSITGYEGNDTITNWLGNNVVIAAMEDDDEIFNFGGDNVIINANEGDDSIISWYDSKNNTIRGGKGNDDISLGHIYIKRPENSSNMSGDSEEFDEGFIDPTLTFYNLIKYEAGDGNDTIEGFTETDTLTVSEEYTTSTVGNDIVVKVGTGSITLLDAATLSTVNIALTPGETVADGQSITLSEGDDTYTNYLEGATILALGGKDSVLNHGANVSINGALGNDTLININGSDNVTLDGGEGEDSISNGVDLNFPMYDAGNSLLIDGGAGNDNIHNGGDSVTIYGGDDNDHIGNDGSDVLIYGGAGDDTFDNESSNVTIDGADGNDSVNNRNDSISVDLGAGNDEVISKGDFVTINSGDNNDTIDNTGDSVIINAGDGNDYIANEGDSLTIDASAGNDIISNGNSLTSSGASPGGSNTIINLGAGNDSITNWFGADSTSINGGEGDDTINSYGSLVTITASTGDDVISLSSDAENVLINYTAGDGKDILWGYSANTSINIVGEKYTSIYSGNDIVFNVGDGSITLKEARDKPKPIIIGESGSSGGNSGGESSSGSSGGNSSGSSGGRGGNDGGSSSGGTSASEGRGSDASGGQSATGSSGTSASRGGNDSGSSSINTSNLNLSGNVRVNHSAETLAATFPTTTVTTPTTNSAGQYVYTGGNQIISDYQSWQKIIFSDYTESLYDGAGNFLIGSSNGALAIENAVDKIIDVSDASGNAIVKAYLSGEAGVVDGRGLEGYEIIHGSFGEDLIYAGDYGSQLWGNADNAVDSLVGGAGSDFFVGGMNQGADLFFNVSSADAINLNDATLENIVATYENEDKIAIAFDNGNIIGVQSSEALSGAFVLADGSVYRYNHINRTWQNE